MEDFEVTAAVMLMANMQELHMSDPGPVQDTDGLSQVHDPNMCLIHEIASPSTSAYDKEQVVQNNSFLSPQEDEQMNTVFTFDDDDQINPVVSFDDQINDYNNDYVEQHELLFDPDLDLKTLVLTTQSNGQKCNELNLKLKAKIVLLTKDLECYKSQLTTFENKEKREKSFEAAFQE